MSDESKTKEELIAENTKLRQRIQELEANQWYEPTGQAPGDSGGGLFSVDGKLLGINRAINTRDALAK